MHVWKKKFLLCKYPSLPSAICQTVLLRLSSALVKGRIDAIAAREGLRFAFDLGLIEIEMEGDAGHYFLLTLTIKAWKGYPPWCLLSSLEKDNWLSLNFIYHFEQTKKKSKEEIEEPFCDSSRHDRSMVLSSIPHLMDQGSVFLKMFGCYHN